MRSIFLVMSVFASLLSSAGCSRDAGAPGGATGSGPECFVCQTEVAASAIGSDVEVLLARTRSVARQMLFGRGQDNNILVSAATIYAVDGGGQMGEWADRIDALTSEAQVRFALDKFGRELTTYGLIDLGLGSAQAKAVMDAASVPSQPPVWVVRRCDDPRSGTCPSVGGAPCVPRDDVALCGAPSSGSSPR